MCGKCGVCFSIFNLLNSKKYNKLNESSKIINDEIQETTYTPQIPDNIDCEYEKIFHDDSSEDYIFGSPKIIK